MLGLIHAEEENPDRKINAADETEIPAVPFNEAMQFLKSKVPMSKAEWLELEPKLRFRAFTVAQLGSAEVVDKAKQILLKSFEKGGGTYSDTWEELKKKVNVNALDIKPGYWENVFRTNTQSAYIAGKLQQYENSNVAAYQLMVIEDGRTSRICRHLLTASGYGMIISVDHPFWKKYGFPPYHFQCRTSIRAIWPSQVGKLGNMVENPTMKSLSKFKVQEGFGGNPLDRGSWWEMTDSMKRLAEKFEVMEKIEAAGVALGVDGVYGSGDETIKHKTIKELKKIGNIAKGDEMTFEEADSGNVNPFIILGGDGYRFNCQTCVAAFEARMRGFNVRAKAYDKNSVFFKRLSNNPLRAFINSEGRHPKWTEEDPAKEIELFKSWKDCLNFVKKNVKRGERYVMEFDWERNGRGHIVSVIRTKKGKLFFYDPQDGSIYDRDYYSSLLKKMVYKGKYDQPKILRVDDLQLDGNVLKYVVEACDE